MFKYVVNFHDESENRAVTDRGLVNAKSWSKAIARVRKFYGADSVYWIKLEEWGNVIMEEELLDTFSHTED